MSLSYDEKGAAALISFVRAGAFPLVAAEAAGVRRDILRRWVKLGSREKACEPWRGFVSRLGQAMAEARARIELEVARKDPKFWLEHGPGKEKADYPGWSAAVRPAAGSSEQERWQASTELQALCEEITKVLANYPEARLAVARILENRKRDGKHKCRSRRRSEHSPSGTREKECSPARREASEES